MRDTKVRQNALGGAGEYSFLLKATIRRFSYNNSIPIFFPPIGGKPKGGSPLLRYSMEGSERTPNLRSLGGGGEEARAQGGLPLQDHLFQDHLFFNLGRTILFPL